MKKLSTMFFALFMCAAVLTGCTGTNKDNQSASQSGESGKNQSAQVTEITVSAAASLKDALGEIQKLYAAKKPEVKVTISFGSSGELQQQIEQGSPVDLFFSAGKKQMDNLEKENLIIRESRSDILSNDMVLIVGKDNNTVKSFRDLSKPSVKNIGIGTPESVPAGKYAKETLTSMKLWDTLKPKLVPAKDVRQVLAYVETGNAEAGLVYGSDALISDKVKIAAVAPADSHKPIVYPAAIVAATKNRAAAEDFLNFLHSKEATGVFLKYGFQILK